MTKADPLILEERAVRLRELLERDPDDASGWFGLGHALLELGRPTESIDAFRHAVRIRPDYTAAHRDLGRALLETGAAVEAAEVFARAVSLAEKTGDLQTGREIHIYLRRAEKSIEPS